MKDWTHMGALILVLMWMACLPIPVHAAGHVQEQINEYGYIDWLNQKVYATGIGMAPEAKTNQTQAKTLAYRAAMVVAQRNLLEVIKGVHIDSQTLLEKRIVSDEKIISKIEGVVRFSQVESSRQMDDGAVSVTISMPLSGQMGEILIHAIEDSGQPAEQSSRSQEIMQRLSVLEKRVTALEHQLSRLKDISADQKSMIHLLTYLVEAWQRDAEHRRHFFQVGFASDEETAALRHQIDQQEKQMAAMAIHLNDLSSRLVALEKNMEEKIPTSPTDSPSKTYPYTGLIVDARDIGFKPSLRPGLFHQGQQIYPGRSLNLSRAIQGGYVRYYNDRYQAQQSDRIGTLPYFTKATETYGGERGLALDREAFNILRSVHQHPHNFLSRCKVVIIF